MSSVAGTRFGHLTRAARRHIPTIPASSSEQLRHNILNLVKAAFMGDSEFFKPKEAKGLKKIPPYWYPYTTMTKQRWIGRELLEIVSTEFRDRSMEYYRYALESGVTTVNGKIASPDTILKNGDRIEFVKVQDFRDPMRSVLTYPLRNIVHRHEPPVTSTPVRVLLHDKEREFIVVDKPGSIPVHASGRYNRNSLNEILVNDFGFEKVYAVNRLDRLTSGLMVIPLSVQRARQLTGEFMAGTVRKEYIARVKGRFPAEEVVCEEPLLTVDRQMGLNIVHPEGKDAKTVFNIIHYDEITDSSVVRCRPFTGRSHQIRVHLQFLGHPVANDPVYSEKRIWGENVGQGGIDVTPSDEREAPAPPEHLQELVEGQGNPELLKSLNDDTAAPLTAKRLPRETGEDIGMGSPVPLSKEAVGVITRLRSMKDEDEDWSRWRDVVFRVKGKLNPQHIVIKPPPPQNRRRRGGKADVEEASIPTQPESYLPSGIATPEGTTPAEIASPQFATLESATVIDAAAEGPKLEVDPNLPPPGPQISLEDAIRQATTVEPGFDTIGEGELERIYCPECYLPLHPDPSPEKLYIFLHALKYTTSLGEFSTEMPEWAAKDWTWETT